MYLYKKLLAVAVATMTLNQTAYSRGDKRDGFNFGTSIGLGSNQFRQNGSNEQSYIGKSVSESKSFSPYLGYSFDGLFNVGINGNMENSLTEENEHITASNTDVIKHSESQLKSTSLFGRLLFGRILFFELGFGFYHNQVSESREEKVANEDNSFSGNYSENQRTGAGPGYHFSMGIEIPVIAGFHITSAYKNTLFQLREWKNESLGAKQAQKQQSELSFGLAYYYQ